MRTYSLVLHIYQINETVSLGIRSYFGLRQNSFMALTAVMKLFCVYLAPYSLFFRTARTAYNNRGKL